MGSWLTKVSPKQNDNRFRLKGFSSVYDDLGLNNDDIDKIYGIFQSIQKNGNTSDALFLCLDINNSSEFGFIIMQLFNPYGSNTANFENFLIAVWSIITIDERNLSAFLFNLLDNNGKGILYQNDIDNIINNILELPPEMRILVNDLFIRLCDTEKLQITFKEFNQAVKEFPFLISPLRKIFTKIRSTSIDNDRFIELQSYRYKKYGHQSFLYIISKMKRKPESYEKLIKLYNNKLIQNDNTNINSSRDSEVYLIPVLTMELNTSIWKSSIKKSAKEIKKRNSVSVLTSSLTSLFSIKLSPSKDKAYGHSPSGSKSAVDSSNYDTTGGSLNSVSKEQKEAMRILQEWAKKDVRKDSNPGRNNLGSASGSFKKKKRGGGDGHISSGEKISYTETAARKLDDDKNMEIIEQSFWSPPSKHKNDRNNENSERSYRKKSARRGETDKRRGYSVDARMLERDRQMQPTVQAFVM